MATAVERTNIIKLVTAMFNAAPGATYLSELTSFFDASGGTSLQKLAALANALGNTTAYKTLNPVFQTASEFASKFLTQYGLQSNQEAIDFIVAKFNAGVPKGQIAFEATVALNNSTAPVFADARAILDNKTAVAFDYSVTKATAETDITKLTAALSGVTKDPATVNSQIATNDAAASSSSGSIFTLTSGADTLTPTSSTAALKTTAGDDTFRATTTGDLASADFLDAGAGTDTLNYVDTAVTAPTVRAPSLTSVEIVNVTMSGGLASGDSVTFSGANATGLTTVVSKNSVGNATSTQSSVVTVTNIATTVSVGIEGGSKIVTVTPSTDLAPSLTATYLNVSGAADASTLTLKNGVANIVTIAGIETLTVTENGVTAASTVASLVVANATTLTVNATGKGATIAATTAANLKTINAAGSTGPVSINVDGSNAATTFTGGAGNDTVIFGATNTFTTADTVNGGAGIDTLAVNRAQGANTTAAFTNITAFETLKINDATTAADTINLAHFGVQNIEFGAAATATTTVQGVNTGATATFATASGATLQIGTNTTADTLNLVVKGAGVTYTLDATQFETLTVNTAGATGISTFVLTDPQMQSLTLTQAASATNDFAVNLGTLGVVTNTVNLAGFAATTAANGVTVTLSSAAVNGATVTGSGNNDTIVGSSQADTIIGGAGADTITGGNGVDTLTGGTGVDSFVFTGISLAVNRDVITDFTAGATGDTIKLDSALTTVATTGGTAPVVTADTTAAGTGGGAYGLTGASSSNADVVVLQNGVALTSGANGGDLSASINGTELLKALTGSTAVDTYTGITAAGASNLVYLLAYQGSNAYFYAASDANADSLISASEINLVATLTGVAAQGLVAANYAVLA